MAILHLKKWHSVADDTLATGEDRGDIKKQKNIGESEVSIIKKQTKFVLWDVHEFLYTLSWKFFRHFFAHSHTWVFSLLSARKSPLSMNAGFAFLFVIVVSLLENNSLAKYRGSQALTSGKRGQSGCWLGIERQTFSLLVTSSPRRLCRWVTCTFHTWLTRPCVLHLLSRC